MYLKSGTSASGSPSADVTPPNNHLAQTNSPASDGTDRARSPRSEEEQIEQGANDAGDGYYGDDQDDEDDYDADNDDDQILLNSQLNFMPFLIRFLSRSRQGCATRLAKSSHNTWVLLEFFHLLFLIF
jgi:hypothetical protein